jgi:hypothetical protein
VETVVKNLVAAVADDASVAAKVAPCLTSLS